jgi:hypothetical protein
MLTPYQEQPLSYVDFAKDEICYDYTSDYNFLPRKSNYVLEINLGEYLSALDSHPFYMPDILPSTYDRSLWDADRKRLVARLLEETEKVRQLPPELRDWDLDSLVQRR